MRRAVTLFLVLCSLMLVQPRAGRAQDATPPSGSIPEPAECQVEPRPTEDLMALWAGFATPEAGDAVASPDAGTPFTGLPAGEPADAETIDAVTATVREVFACFNAGDFVRSFSLYTDNLVQSFGPELGMSAEDARTFLEGETATPVPEDQRIVLISVTNVVVMDDGRVGAIVVSNDPTVEPEGAETALVSFVEENGRWL